MNKQRRSDIRVQIAILDHLAQVEGKTYKELIEGANATVSDLETARDDEQDYFDNMPESFQGGEKGEMAEQAIQALQSGIDALAELDGLIDPNDEDMTDEDRVNAVQDVIAQASEELENFE
jgi:hypothetical protein